MHLFSRTPRLLLSTEWDRLTPFASYFGGAIPSPEVAQVIVVEEKGEIVSFMVLEAIVHLGPVWVDPTYRGRGSFYSMLKMAYGIFPKWRGAICFTDNPKLIRAAQALGLQRLKQVAFKWENTNE